MNWKDITIGSIATLIVTVLGGVVIYYVTKEPRQSAPAEVLVYEVTHIGEFNSVTTRMALQTIRVTNIGDAAATQVRVMVEYAPEVKVVDKLASMSSGPVGVFDVALPRPNGIEATLPTLIANESLLLSVVLDRGIRTLPTVAVRSERTIGKPRPQLRPEVNVKAERNAAAGRISMWLIPSVFLLQVPLMLYFFRRAQLGGTYTPSLNNAGFALMHQGSLEEALAIFRQAVLRGEGDALVLANRALALHLNGKLEEGRASLAAAELFDKGGRGRAVINFNKALMALLESRMDDAVMALTEAMKSDPQDVARWATHSVIFKAQVIKTPDLAKIVERV